MMSRALAWLKPAQDPCKWLYLSTAAQSRRLAAKPNVSDACGRQHLDAKLPAASSSSSTRLWGCHSLPSTHHHNEKSLNANLISRTSSVRQHISSAVLLHSQSSRSHQPRSQPRTALNHRHGSPSAGLGSCTSSLNSSSNPRLPMPVPQSH